MNASILKTFTVDNRPKLMPTYTGVSHVGEDVGSVWIRLFGLGDWKKVPNTEDVYYIRAKELPIVLTCVRIGDGRLDVAYYDYLFPEFKKLWDDKEGRQELYANCQYFQIDEDGNHFIKIYEWLKAHEAV